MASKGVRKKRSSGNMKPKGESPQLTHESKLNFVAQWQERNWKRVKELRRDRSHQDTLIYGGKLRPSKIPEGVELEW